MSAPVAPTHEQLGLVVPVREVVDPALWRERYAYGLLEGRPVLGIGVGAPSEGTVQTMAAIPDSTIAYHLRVAMSALEMRLGVPLACTRWKADPVDDGLVLGVHYDAVAPRLPYTLSGAQEWYRIDLPSGCVSIERLRAYYYDTLVWELDGSDPNLLQLQWSRQGIAHLIPVHLQSLAVDALSGNYGIWHTLTRHKHPVPRFWAIDYTTGPTTQQGVVGKVELVLAHWVAMIAAFSVFGMDSVLRTYGVQSQSVSFDGLSRSVSLAPNVYSGMLEQFKYLVELIDWNALRTAKRGIKLQMYGY